MDQRYCGLCLAFQDDIRLGLMLIPSQGPGEAFTISESGAISGHTRWQEFSFHDYFGTLHPYANDMDALHYGTADTSYAFNWRFHGDTLKLRPLGSDGDRYWLEQGELRYVKR